MADRTEIMARRRRVKQRERRELELFTRRLGFLLVALVVLVIAGTVGFTVVEGVSVPYAFDWTVDTITTLGSIPDPHSSGARILKVCLELFGIGTLFYGLATVAEFFVSGQLSGLLEERRNQKMIDSFSDHYIVCGFGRVGRQVSRDLRSAGVSHVVIDSSPDHREAASGLELPYIENEASRDDVLQQAGIARARGVIACVDSDAENIFIALTARELREDILIIARASAEDSEKKLLRAGADRVISPYKTSGSEMARLALHPPGGGGRARLEWGNAGRAAPGAAQAPRAGRLLDQRGHVAGAGARRPAPRDRRAPRRGADRAPGGSGGERRGGRPGLSQPCRGR